MKSGKLESVKPRSRRTFILLDDMYVLLTISGKCRLTTCTCFSTYLENVHSRYAMPQQAIDLVRLGSSWPCFVLRHVLSMVLPARVEYLYPQHLQARR
jgi:hypothetical protein